MSKDNFVFEVFLLKLGCGVNCQKIGCYQCGVVDQVVIDVGYGKQFCGIVWFDIVIIEYL